MLPTLFSPLPPLLLRVQKFLLDWAPQSRKSLLSREWRLEEVSFYPLSRMTQWDVATLVDRSE